MQKKKQNINEELEKENMIFNQLEQEFTAKLLTSDNKAPMIEDNYFEMETNQKNKQLMNESTIKLKENHGNKNPHSDSDEKMKSPNHLDAAL